MAITWIEANKSDNGETLPPLPMLQLVLNNNQQICILGADFDVNPMEFGTAVLPDGRMAKTDNYGKLSEQNFIFHSQLVNSLRMEAWDFDAYPDPEVLIVSIVQ